MVATIRYIYFRRDLYKKPEIMWFMSCLNCSDSTYTRRYSILEGSALPVSGGSFFRTSYTVACAWAISTPDGQEWIEGGRVIPGEANDKNS